MVTRQMALTRRKDDEVLGEGGSGREEVGGRKEVQGEDASKIMEG